MDEKEKQIAKKILDRILSNEGITQTDQYDGYLQMIYDNLKAIQVQAHVSPACKQLEKNVNSLLVDVERQLNKCPYGKPRGLLLYMQEQIKAILTIHESKWV